MYVDEDIWMLSLLFEIFFNSYRYSVNYPAVIFNSRTILIGYKYLFLSLYKEHFTKYLPIRSIKLTLNFSIILTAPCNWIPSNVIKEVSV